MACWCSFAGIVHHDTNRVRACLCLCVCVCQTKRYSERARERDASREACEACSSVKDTQHAGAVSLKLCTVSFHDCGQYACVRA